MTYLKSEDDFAIDKDTITALRITHVMFSGSEWNRLIPSRPLQNLMYYLGLVQLH